MKVEAVFLCVMATKSPRHEGFFSAFVALYSSD